MSENKIIKRIEKLMRLANNQKGTPEGEVAASMAARLMAQHAIEAAQLDLNADRTNDPFVRKNFKCPKTAWTRHLGTVIGNHCFVKFAFSQGQWALGGAYYGFQSDTEVALYLFNICKKQIETASRHHLRELRDEHDAESEWYGFSYRESTLRHEGKKFRCSAVVGLSEKLVAMRDEVKQDVGTASYALVIQRRAQANTWAHENHAFESASRGRSYGSSHAGYEAGKRVNVGRGIHGETPNKKLRG